MSDELPADWLEQLKNEYPKRAGGHGWGHARVRVLARIKEGHAFEQIKDGTSRYRHYCTNAGISGTEFVKQAQTFYGPGLWFLDDYDTHQETEDVAELAKIFKTSKLDNETYQDFALRVKRMNEERLNDYRNSTKHQSNKE